MTKVKIPVSADMIKDSLGISEEIEGIFYDGLKRVAYIYVDKVDEVTDTAADPPLEVSYKV